MEKNIRYEHIIEQLKPLLDKTEFPFSRMATTIALLHNKMDNFLWTGFYLLYREDLLVGPYQGQLACVQLKKNTGVCWSAINNKKTIIVPDVHNFEGHITCDSRTNSEIATPVYFRNGQVAGVLDIDSQINNNFDETDAIWLEKIAKLMYI